MMNSRIAIAVLCMLTAAAFRATAHDHFTAGIVDSNGNGQPDAGEPLQFVGEDGSDRKFHLLPRPVGYRPIQRCGGYYALDERPRTLFPTDAFSLTALSDGQIEIAAPGHAHTGAWIWVEITAVSGPEGGNFGFWDENRSYYHDTPTVSLPANTSFPPHAFVLSEGTDHVSEDPQGHIHGRSWTADLPGDYFVSLRLVDRSTSGPGGGPWHPPSETYVFHFLAGPDFRVTPEAMPDGSLRLTWQSSMGIDAGDPAQVGIAFEVERSSSLGATASWEVLGTVTGTTGATAAFTDPEPPDDTAFYRLKYQWSTDESTP